MLSWWKCASPLGEKVTDVFCWPFDSAFQCTNIISQLFIASNGRKRNAQIIIGKFALFLHLVKLNYLGSNYACRPNSPDHVLLMNLDICTCCTFACWKTKCWKVKTLLCWHVRNDKKDNNAKRHQNATLSCFQVCAVFATTTQKGAMAQTSHHG